MGWKVGKVQEVDTGLNGFSGPGFVLQQDGRSPSLTIVFHDQKTADESREKFEEIIDSAAVVLPMR
jgi:hypothetical protein